MRVRHACVLGILLTGCGGSKGGPGPTPVTEAPQITCPADITVKSVSGTTQRVTFPTPTVSNGTAPVTATCDRASGSDFPLGSTQVRCTATDAQQRSASCSFNVSLAGFTLSVKKFDTFGDSLTTGETGKPNFVDTENSYPTRLRQMLDAYYPAQGMTVVNRGENGRTAAQTRDLIRTFVPVDRPDAVLILTGFNNLTIPCPPGASASAACDAAVEQVEDDVVDAIRKARESSSTVKYVFVSTLTPPGPTGSARIDRTAINLVNGRLKQSVAAEKAVLVDSYAAFVGHEADYVNADGLHLRPAGYQALADAFFTAIKATVPQTPLLTLNR